MRLDIWPGAALVAVTEVRATLRTRRWQVALAIWLVVVAAIAWLTTSGTPVGSDGSHDRSIFDAVLLVVMTLLLLISPVLSAGSINGDRERCRLAPLQTTGLSPTSIATGKFLAAWLVGLTALAVATPALVVLAVLCQVAPGDLIVAFVAVALMIGTINAVSLGLSALFNRVTTSTAVAYLLVVGLTIGTLLISSVAFDETENGSSPDRWIALAPNPYVLLADAIPPTKEPSIDKGLTEQSLNEQHNRYEQRNRDGILSEIRNAVRHSRQSTTCDGPYACTFVWNSYDWVDSTAVWPYGLGFDLALAGAGLYATTRRLRTPVTRLPQGTRID